MMKSIPRYFIVLYTLLTGCVPAPAAPPVEPNAGSWQTWVVTDVAAVRPAAPPDQTATQSELKEVQAAVVKRIAFAQNRATPASGPRIIRTMSLLNVAIYDAMVAAWDAKYAFNRARPSAMSPGLSVLAQHTNSPSYPSEHAVAAGAAASILGYVYPDLAQDFQAKAQEAANSRVAAGGA